MPPDSNSPPAVLITGSSTGIGRACAVELDRRGWRVLAGVRREEDAERLRAEGSDRLMPVMLDVTDAGSISAAAAAVAGAVRTAGLAGLVNNAGIVVAGPVELVPIDDLRRQLEVNVLGQAAVTQAMLPMLRAARGRIVMMSSVSGRVAAPFLGPYAASKHALEALSDSLRVEVHRWGIRVSLVEPGSVETPIWEKSVAAADALAEVVPPEGEALYHDDLEKIRAAVDEIAAGAMPVERVVRAVVHALTARRSKTRYPVGADTRVFVTLSKFLPTPVRDWVIRKKLGLE